MLSLMGASLARRGGTREANCAHASLHLAENIKCIGGLLG